MHDIKARPPGFHGVDDQEIFFAQVRSLNIRQDGKPAGHAPEDGDVAIEDKLADCEVVERRIGNVGARTFENDPAERAGRARKPPHSIMSTMRSIGDRHRVNCRWTACLPS
jgi:hypothetical protein